MTSPERNRAARATNLYGLLSEEVAQLTPLEGEPAYRADQIARWIYGGGAEDFEGMTNLSKELRRRLAASCRIERIRPSRVLEAGDGSAAKFLFPLSDGVAIEAVWIRDPRRDALCISSQAGCAYGCTFCATAAMRAGRNLETGEILGQVAALREAMSAGGEVGVHNLVFMGMGEPLANYANLVRALRILTGEPGFGMAARRITVSTVGLVPEIHRLAGEGLGVRLAFSLNATTDETRSRLMPVNRKHPFREVFGALREYQRAQGAPVTLEYVLLRGVNDTPEDAHRLARFARSLQCKVNLIAYNAHPHTPFEPVGEAAIERFRGLMVTVAETTRTVRWSTGRDIQAACGQLATGGKPAGGEPSATSG